MTEIGTALEFVDGVLRHGSVVSLIADFEERGYEKRLQMTSKRHDLIAISLRDACKERFRDYGAHHT